MLFAQDAAVQQLVSAMPWYGWIAIVAILGGTISGVIKLVFQHRERMAMIAQGMNPDLPAEPGKARIGEL
jgi:hypothetical protein